MHAAPPSTAQTGLGVPPPPPLTAPPPSLEASSGQGVKSWSTEDDNDKKRKVKNPGSYDEVHRKAKGEPVMSSYVLV